MISNKQICQECKECCYFYLEESYFAPLITKEELAKIPKDKQAYFKPYKESNNTFQVQLIRCKKDNDYVCPMLDEETYLCEIYDSRPFDCKIWPFIIMKDKQGKTVLACSNKSNCRIIKNMPDKEFNSHFKKLLAMLKDKGLLEWLNKNKDLIWDYEDDTFIIKELT